jgi:hypothetical protein
VPVGAQDNFKLDDSRLSIEWNDVNGNDLVDIGDTYLYTLSGIEAEQDGFVYVNIHLDYGLEKTSGWLKGGLSGNDALNNGTVQFVDGDAGDGTAAPENGAILDLHQYAFSADVDNVAYAGSDDSIYNNNIYKNIKGIGGLFQADDTVATPGVPDETPLADQHLIMVKSDGTVMGDAYSDEDGWYYAEFMATGKLTNYTVWWDQNNDGSWTDEAADHGKAVDMGGKAGKWAQVDFTLEDPVDVAPPLGVVDSYSDIL